MRNGVAFHHAVHIELSNQLSITRIRLWQQASLGLLWGGLEILNDLLEHIEDPSSPQDIGVMADLLEFIDIKDLLHGVELFGDVELA